MAEDREHLVCDREEVGLGFIVELLVDHVENLIVDVFVLCGFWAVD